MRSDRKIGVRMTISRTIPEVIKQLEGTRKLLKLRNWKKLARYVILLADGLTRNAAIATKSCSFQSNRLFNEYPMI